MVKLLRAFVLLAGVCAPITAVADPWDPVMPDDWWGDDPVFGKIPWPSPGDGDPLETKDPPMCAVIKACMESWECLHDQSDTTLEAWSITLTDGTCPHTTVEPPKRPK